MFSIFEESKKDDGFTLIEVLIVLVIIVLLASFVGPRVVGYLSDSRIKAAKIQIEGFAAALELYRLDIGKYPSDSEGLSVLIKKPDNDNIRWNGPYLRKKEIPKDPWGNTYIFTNSKGSSMFSIISYGSDGLPGGEGEDKDIKY